MRIVVVGAGKLGYSIAELLSNEQFDVVVVDHDEERLEVVKNTLDVLTVHANGASPITMNNPDIQGSDVLVAATAIDEVNMVPAFWPRSTALPIQRPAFGTCSFYRKQRIT